MKALVTGAPGFIGSYLVETLLKRGYEVTCLVRKTSNLRWIEHLDVRYLMCDLAEIESRASEIKDFHYIFHLAGATKASCEMDFHHANAECTENLVRATAATASGVERFVYLSSLAAVGPGEPGRAVDEDTVPRPVSWYGKSKLGGEKAVLAHKDSLPVTILRPPAVYGPRDTDFFVMFKMIQKGFFPYWGKCYYSLLYVEDLVRGIISAAEKKEATGGTFFLCDDIIYTNEQIAAEIGAALGAKALRIRLPRSFLPALGFLGQKIDKRGIINGDRVNDFRFSNWTCDASRAKNELGFHSQITLREGIKWTADWYRIHRWL
jgi:nucleoside-diphosphate-sugar epimerase